MRLCLPLNPNRNHTMVSSTITTSFSILDLTSQTPSSTKPNPITTNTICQIPLPRPHLKSCLVSLNAPLLANKLHHHHNHPHDLHYLRARNPPVFIPIPILKPWQPSLFFSFLFSSLRISSAHFLFLFFKPT